MTKLNEINKVKGRHRKDAKRQNFIKSVTITAKRKTPTGKSTEEIGRTKSEQER